MIGGGGAAILLVAMIAAPAVLRSGAAANRASAAEQAELALRQMHSYDSRLASVVGDGERLKSAEFDVIMGRVADDLTKATESFSTEVNAAKRIDNDAGMPATQLRAVSGDPSSMRTAVATFEKLLRENQKLLADASVAAKQAADHDKDVPGLALTRGLTRLVEAQELIRQARDARRAFSNMQTELLLLAADWARANATHQEYAGVDVTKVVAQLEAEVKGSEDLIVDVSKQHAAIEKNIADHEAQLATTKTQLASAREAYNAILDTGFKAGDDASYAAYRDKLAAASDVLRDVQALEQWLVAGGARGAKLSNDDLIGGPIEGGEAFVGIENLKIQRDVLKTRLEELNAAKQRTETAIKNTRAYAAESQKEAAARDVRVKEAFDTLDKARAKAEELSKTAAELEDRALSAARDAGSTFASAATSLQQLREPARQDQSDFDPQRKNPRLTMILGDDLAELQHTSLAAEAKALVGSVLADRVDSLKVYRDTLEQITKIVKGATYDKDSLQTAIDAGFNEAMQALGDARQQLEPLASAGKPTTWIQQATLGCVLYKLAMLDKGKDSQFMTGAIDNLNKAVTSREQSPFLARELLALKVSIAGDAAPAPDQPKQGEGDGESQPPAKDNATGG